MKKKLSLVITLILVFSLLSGCGNNGNEIIPTEIPVKETATISEEPSEKPVDSPYKFAVGNYEVNKQGFPTDPYEYELPLSTTDETFTYWTTVFTPQYIPEEGFDSMEFPSGLRERTGVNIEYIVASAESRQQNYSVLLAADDLCDIMTQAVAFHPDTFEQAIEDEYWVNLYEYKEYMPNYLYKATYDPSEDIVFETVFYKKEIIVAFYTLYKESVVNSNYTARGDWLDDVGLINDDIITFDDLHNMLTLFKANIETCEFPWPLFSTIDMAGAYTFTAYDTLPFVNTTDVGPAYVVDGNVRFSHIGENDREFMTLLHQWFVEGLIDPNWSSYANNTHFTDKITTSQVGYVFMSPGEIIDYKTNTTNDEDVDWVPIHKPLRYEGQTIHLGGEISRVVFGSATVSASCENIPLAVTWLDFGYSPSGSEYLSFGPEGLLFEKDESGKRKATEFALTHSAGYSWALTLYALNGLVDSGLQDNSRKYAYEGGEKVEEVHKYWADYSYDGAYKWPAGVNFTQDQLDQIDIYKNDVATYISENYTSFVDGSKPLSEWDVYISDVYNIGIDKVIAVYQQAYEDYLAEKNA